MSSLLRRTSASHCGDTRGGWSSGADDARSSINRSRSSIESCEVTLDGARRESVDNLAAYECWLCGMNCLKRGTLEGNEEWRPLFEQALQIDAHDARSSSGLSRSHFNEWTSHAWHLRDENERNAFDYATQAARLDDRDAMVHSLLARVYRFRHQHRQADQHAERAL